MNYNSSILIFFSFASNSSLYSLHVCVLFSFSRSNRILLLFFIFCERNFSLILQRTNSWSLFITAPGYDIVDDLCILDLNL